MADETLKIKEFVIKNVQFGPSYSLSEHKLVIPQITPETIPETFRKVNITIINPHHLDVATDSIMDVVPISTKVLGTLGTGVTHTLTGVSMIITGSNENGKQIHDFGSSDGTLSKQMMLNKDGTPDENDFIIMFNVVLKSQVVMDRQMMTTVFSYADDYLQPIREILKKTNGRYADYNHEYSNTVHPGKPKVVVIKQVSGQGTMYDNILFPQEPNGIKGGISIIDLNNFPVLLTPNEYRDGAIHALV